MKTLVRIALVLAVSSCCNAGAKKTEDDSVLRPMAKEPDTGGRPYKGEEGYAYSKSDTSKEVIVFPSMLLADQWDKAVGAKDTIGMAEVSMASYVVTSGTKLLMLKSGPSYSEVRILSGNHLGEAGHIPSDFVHRNPPTDQTLRVSNKRELDAATVANVLQSQTIVINCKPATPSGNAAKASEVLACAMPRALDENATIYAFASKADYDVTVKAFMADKTIGTHRYSNPQARILVHLSKGVPADIGAKCKAIVEKL